MFWWEWATTRNGSANRSLPRWTASGEGLPLPGKPCPHQIPRETTCLGGLFVHESLNRWDGVGLGYATLDDVFTHVLRDADAHQHSLVDSLECATQNVVVDDVLGVRQL